MRDETPLRPSLRPKPRPRPSTRPRPDRRSKIPRLQPHPPRHSPHHATRPRPLPNARLHPDGTLPLQSHRRHNLSEARPVARFLDPALHKIYATIPRVTSPRYRFGLFEFDASTLELRRDGKLIRLQSQPAQLLACLLDRAGDTVSREDLRAAIWGSDTFVDFDRGFNFCIAQIRSALDDDTVSPRFIRTFPRRGYQFIAPVERIDERIEPSSESPLEMAQPVQASRKFSTTTLLMACAATALIILSAGSAYIVAARHVSKSRPIVAILRFDNETSDPSIKTFSDAVTDTLVEQLTARSVGHYEVIGNAQILRL